jgi:hypothetical protein
MYRVGWMEIVMGYAYLGWMANFGLIGVILRFGSTKVLPSANDFAALILRAILMDSLLQKFH